MDVTPQIPAGRQVIQGYGSGGFRIANTRHEGSVLVFAERTLAWPVTSFDLATGDSLAEIVAAAPKVEILLIGTGAKMQFIPAGVADSFPRSRHHGRCDGHGARACRTYNVMSEDRRVAAALIAIS